MRPVSKAELNSCALHQNFCYGDTPCKQGSSVLPEGLYLCFPNQLHMSVTHYLGKGFQSRYVSRNEIHLVPKSFIMLSHMKVYMRTSVYNASLLDCKFVYNRKPIHIILGALNIILTKDSTRKEAQCSRLPPEFS